MAGGIIVFSIGFPTEHDVARPDRSESVQWRGKMMSLEDEHGFAGGI